MNRTKMVISMAGVLTLFTFFISSAFAGPPVGSLYRTTTSFKIKAEKDIHVKAAFNPDGSLIELESCFSKDDCYKVKFEEFRDPREIYTCLPLKNGEKPEGTKVMLKDYRSGEEIPYDCQYVTAIEATDQVMFKIGDNTSCPYYLNGRWHNPCKNK